MSIVSGALGFSVFYKLGTFRGTQSLTARTLNLRAEKVKGACA